MQSSKAKSEEVVFNEWLKSEKEKGLVDFKVYPSNTATASREAVFGELNAMNSALEKGRFERITNL